MPQEAALSRNVLGLIGGELDFRGSFRYRDTYPTAISLLETGSVDVEGLVSFTEPLSNLDQAFERAAEPETVKGVIKI